MTDGDERSGGHVATGKFTHAHGPMDGEQLSSDLLAPVGSAKDSSHLLSANSSSPVRNFSNSRVAVAVTTKEKEKSLEKQGPGAFSEQTENLK